MTTLLHQGDTTEIVVIDNGSNDGTVEWLHTQQVTVMQMPGANIHQMWNQGVRYLLDEYGTSITVGILNNDITLDSEHVVADCAAALADGWTLVSPNYDKRTCDVEVAETYDVGKRGGIAGWAMFFTGEFLSTYQFPETLHWFYGDDDVVLTVRYGEGLRAGIVTNAHITHIGGGSQTRRPDNWAACIQSDKRFFRNKWLGKT